MSPTIMTWFKIIVLLASLQSVTSKIVCPKNCICDVKSGLNRASCTHQNIISVGVGVPENVEIYDLNSNSLHHLEDYCFKDLGYTSLIEIDLSNNLIFWIGLHALADLENLESLNLSNNRLQALASDLFWYNKKIKYLNLSGNKFMGFKNKPFLSHATLEVLNMSKSQISFLPELVFSELPHLKSLDLSKNSMIELQIAIFKPLTSLIYLSLNENNWHCNEMFSDLQVWILQKRIEYVTQCKLKEKQKMFEKMISLVPTEQSYKIADKEVNIETLWNFKNNDDRNDKPKKPITNTPKTFIEIFNSKFPSLWSLIIGIIVGLLIGMVVTYCWMAELLKCRKIRWKSRRQMRRERAVIQTDARPLWDTSMRILANTETPPTARRQISSSNAFCRSDSWEASSFRSLEPIAPPRYASRSQSNGAPVTRSGSDTPPPPYREYYHDRVINTIPEQ